MNINVYIFYMWNSFILKYYERISKEYDKEIRIKCGRHFEALNKCCKDNSDNIGICNIKKKNFEKCTKEFDHDFREEYKNFMRNIKTYF